jgi:hypothetical protein
MRLISVTSKFALTWATLGVHHLVHSSSQEAVEGAIFLSAPVTVKAFDVAIQT